MAELALAQVISTTKEGETVRLANRIVSLAMTGVEGEDPYTVQTYVKRGDSLSLVQR